MTLTRAAVFAALASVVSSVQAEPKSAVSQNRAIDLLLKSIERAHSTAMSGIFSQSAGGGHGCNLQVKIDQSKEGRTRVTTLQPLNMQGVTSVDDGQTWSTYFPDERRLLEQDSPRLGLGNPRERLEHAARNYSFRSTSGETVAGRRTIAILAVPVHEELPVRRYSLDTERNFMLRMETIAEGRTRRVMDTKSITFSPEFDVRLFEIKPMGEVRVIRLDPPSEIRSSRHARATLGFRPAFPDELPFGFAIRNKHLSSNQDVSFVAVRITDGLITATVYQWSATRSEVPWPKARKDREVDGIRFRLVGDLPESVMSRLLDTFVRKAVKNLGHTSEPDLADILLTLITNSRTGEIVSAYVQVQ